MQVTLPTPAAAGAFLLRNWLTVLLATIIAAQHVYINGFGIWPLEIPGLQDKYGTALNKLKDARAELDSISTKRNEQAKATERNIDQAERGNREADERAKKIEQAPTAPNCATPPEILGADL